MTTDAFLARLLPAIEALSLWEVAAVVLGIAYLLLAMRESLWCWHAAFASTAIFLFLFWHAGLLMESALQVYYLAMAVYGWWQWQQGDNRDGDGTVEGLAITRWNPRQHTIAVAAVIITALLSGALLQRHTQAAMPYLDSFTTWGAILTTWMVARKILENWLYWLVIDSVSIFLYLNRELYLTALLFVAYIIIAIFGYRQWSRHYRARYN